MIPADERLPALLSIRDLAVAYGEATVVSQVNLELAAGEVLGIVGESGSGKTTVIRAVAGLLPANGRVRRGDIQFEGQSLLSLNPGQWLAMRRRRMSMIFQDTGAMLNPVRRIGSQFVEYIRAAEPAISRATAREMAMDALQREQLPDPGRIMAAYAFELSGGMRQRVGIAMAMAFSPSLILADEPTSALDVTMQAEIVRQMLEMRDVSHCAFVIVTHNLGVAAYMADQIAVMCSGRVVEAGPTSQVIDHPTHEYTASLLASVPSL